MISRMPEIRPISDLARERQEPVVITQRGRQAAVLVPIELYRKLERMLVPRMTSPRLVQPEDAEQFRLELTVLDRPEE